MKLSFFVRSILFAAALAFFVAAPARAQEEGATTVVDEVIAQVNNDVITLSLLKGEMEDTTKVLMEQQHLTREQAAAEVAKNQPQLIASLINEQLLLQRGEELGLKDEVEAQVNREMLETGRRSGLKTMEELEKAMREQGLDPNAIRVLLRRQIMQNYVLGSEVDRKIYSNISTAEAQKYFNEHRKDFQKPETMTLSEIFLSLAGRNEADVKAKAAQLVAQARGGANFGDLAVANSERLTPEGERFAEKTKGKLGTFAVDDILRNLKPEVAASVKNLKTGEVSDPIRTDEGYIILHVDERTPVGEAAFNENQVKERMTYERAEQAHKEYLANLRKESYIKVAPSYQAAVMPLLKDDSPQKSANNYLSPIRHTPRKTESKKN